MAERVVIELEVSAGPAEQRIREFARTLDRAGQEADRAVARYMGVGNSFDRLAAKVDPAIRAQRELAIAVRAGEAAFARGRTSLEEMTRVIDLYRQRAAAAATGTTAVGNTAQLSAQQLAGMQFQLQDMAVGLASGQSPFMVLMQQGSQLVQSFTQGTGVMAALRAVGTGLVTYLTNPLNVALLAFAGLTAGASALFSVFSGGKEETKELAEETDRLAEASERLTGAIGRMKGGWDEARQAVIRYGRDVTEVERFLAEKTIRETTQELDRALREVANKLVSDLSLSEIFNRRNFALDMPSEAIKAQLQDILLQFVDAARLGRGDVIAFQEELANLGVAIGDTNPELLSLLGRIFDLTLGSDDLALKLEEAEAWLRRIEGAAQLGDDALTGMSDGMRKTGDAASGAVASLERYALALQEIVRSSIPGFAGRDSIIGVIDDAAAALRGLIEAGQNWSPSWIDRLGSLFGPFANPNAPIPRRSPFRDLTQETVETAARAAGVPVPRPNPLRDLTIETEEVKQKFSDAGESLAKAFWSGFDGALKELFLSKDPDLFRVLDAFTKTLASAAIGGITQRLQQWMSGSPAAATPAMPGGSAMPSFAGIGVPAPGIPLPVPKPAVPATGAEAIAAAVSTGTATGLERYLTSGKAASHATGLAQSFQAQLLSFFQAAPGDMRIYSGYRDIDHQARLFADAVAKYGSESAARRWVAPPGRSQHNFGTAADLRFADAATRRWAHANAAAFGLTFPMGHEPWHIEPIGARGGTPSISPPANQNIAPAVAQGTQAGLTGFFQQQGSAAPAGNRMQQFFQGPGGQALMAGLGGFSIGFQNQNPLMGALGGGLSGLMSGGPIGGLTGALGGVVGALIGQYFARQQARKEWEQMAPQRRDLERRLLGIESGSLQEAMDAAEVETQKYIDAAKKAGVSTAELTENLEAFKSRAIAEFVSGVGAMTDALNSGLGMNSPALQAARNIREIGRELESFVADLDNAEAAGGLDPADAQRARLSVLEYAKGLLQVQEPLSAVRTRMLEIQGAANALQQVMVDLGFESEYAAHVIDSQVRKALAALARDFETSLVAGINEARGKGYINQITELVRERDRNLADAASLNVDRSLVLQNFEARLQAIVDAASLSADELAALKAQFPGLADLLKQSAEATKAFADSIKAYLDSLLTGDLTTLSPKEQLAEAQRQFDEQLKLVLGGDAEARSRITGFADQLLSEAREYYASSPEYAAIFDAVRKQLGGAAGLPGFAGGGWVTGGVPGRDSVPAMLMPGEYVVPAHQARGMFGPANDNDNGAGFDRLARVMVDATNAQIRTLQEGFSRLEQRFGELERRTRIEGSREPKVARRA